LDGFLMVERFLGLNSSATYTGSPVAFCLKAPYKALLL